MSVLGEVASIAGIISIAGQTAQATSALYAFVQTYKHVRPKLLEVADEVAQLQKTLNDIQSIATNAVTIPGIDSYCSRLHQKLSACQSSMGSWKDRLVLVLDLKNSSRTGKFLRKVKIAMHQDFFNELRSQIVRSREELILELSILQSASACVLVQKSHVMSTSLQTLQEDQKRSFSVLNQEIHDQQLHKILPTADLLPIEQRLDRLTHLLQQKPPHNYSHNAPEASISSQRWSSLQPVTSNSFQMRHTICGELLPLVDTKLPSTMIMRLVQPAIITYERKGKFRQALIPLKIEDVNAFSISQRLALLDYILKLRLLLWLIERIQVHTYNFTSNADTSVLRRESRIASSWDFYFSCYGMEQGQQFAAQHLLLNFTGSVGFSSMLAILRRLDNELREKLRDSIRLGANKYKGRIEKIATASSMLEKEHKRLQSQWNHIQAEISDVEKEISAKIKISFEIMDSSPASPASISRLQTRLMMLTSRKSDLELMQTFIANRNIFLADMSGSIFQAASWFHSLVA